MAHAYNLSSWKVEAEAPGKTFQVIFSYTASSRLAWADLRPSLRGKGGKWIEFEKNKSEFRPWGRHGSNKEETNR